MNPTLREELVSTLNRMRAHPSRMTFEFDPENFSHDDLHALMMADMRLVLDLLSLIVDRIERIGERVAELER